MGEQQESRSEESHGGAWRGRWRHAPCQAAIKERRRCILRLHPPPVTLCLPLVLSHSLFDGLAFALTSLSNRRVLSILLPPSPPQSGFNQPSTLPLLALRSTWIASLCTKDGSHFVDCGHCSFMLCRQSERYTHMHVLSPTGLFSSCLHPPFSSAHTAHAQAPRPRTIHGTAGMQGQAREVAFKTTAREEWLCRQCRLCIQGDPSRAVLHTCQKVCRACPSDAVTGGLSIALRIKGSGPGKAAVSGGAFKVAVKVRNLGSTDLKHIGLRVTVPVEVEYKRAKASAWVGSPPIFASPNVYWPNLSLPAGKTGRFRLWATVSPCQAPGAFVVDAAVSTAGSNSSSAAAMAPTQVKKEEEDSCPAPTQPSFLRVSFPFLSIINHPPDYGWQDVGKTP